MKILRDAPISRKLTAITMLAVVTALLVTCAGFFSYERITFRRAMTRDLSITAKMIGFNSAAGLSFDDAQAAAQTLQGLSAHPHIVTACVYRADGEVFATYQADPAARPVWPEWTRDGEHFRANSLELFRQIDFAGEMIGAIYLQSDLMEINERLKRYVGIALVVTLGATFAAFMLSSRLQRIVSNPLSELAFVSSRVAAGNDYSVRAIKRGDDELGRLIDGFNHMLAQIEAREAELKAAHDHLERRVEERTIALKQAQEEAARERARFKFIFETLPVGVTWMLSGQTDTRLVNASHARITGVPIEDCYQLERYRMATHPDDRSRQDALHARLLGGEIEHYTIEKRYVLPDGVINWVELTVRLVRDPVGGEVQEIGTVVDLTERKRAERKLADSLSILQATLQASVDGILVVDRNARITTFNQKFVDIWRIPSAMMAAGDDEVVLAHVAAQVKASAAFKAKISELYAHPEAESFDIIEVSDGRLFERYSRPQRIDGSCVGRVWCFRDITERVAAETHLASVNRRLLDISRQAGMAEVATGVLHNVGNVLNSVNVSATLLGEHIRQSKSNRVGRLRDLLRANESDLEAFVRSERGRHLPRFLDTLTQELAGEQTEMLGEVDLLRRNIEHIKDIVAMQQNYAKVSGVAEMITVGELVEDALRMNAGAFARHEVKLVRDFQANPTLTVDKHRVLQILVNLMRNAKYACDESGRTDKQMTISVSASDAQVKIAVIDNGVGIPPENLTRIFAHGFTTRKEGHGFGLHSGALAARELGGLLTVHSAGPGQGATFTLELPLAERRSA